MFGNWNHRHHLTFSQAWSFKIPINMVSSSAENEQLANADYWDDRYKGQQEDQSADKASHEWYRSYQDLESFFDNHLFTAFKPDTQPCILHLGSGDSV